MDDPTTETLPRTREAVATLREELLKLVEGIAALKRNTAKVYACVTEGEITNSNADPNEVIGIACEITEALKSKQSRATVRAERAERNAIYWRGEYRAEADENVNTRMALGLDPSDPDQTLTARVVKIHLDETQNRERRRIVKDLRALDSRPQLFMTFGDYADRLETGADIGN